MRIGIVCQNFPPATFEGGISHYSSLLAEHLVKRGHRVFAITSTEFSRQETAALRQLSPKVIKIKGPWDYRSVLEIKKLVIKEGMDGLILQYSPASFKGSFRFMWAISPFPCKKITAFHTLWGSGWIDRALGLLVLAGSQKIIATNSEIMTLLERYLQGFLKKTCWIPIGSNILPTEDQSKEHPSDAPLIIFFGMIYPGKGLDMIIDVLETLKNRQKRFNFKFIGGVSHDIDGYEEVFRNRIKERKLDDVIEHIGLVPAVEVSTWLKRSRFVFLPYEGGLSDRRGSLMAAISHEKAVLTSPPAVSIPYMKNGVNVLWPEVSSVDAYAVLIEQLLEDDILLNTIERGAKELSINFTWDKIAAEHELLLSMDS